MVSKSLAVQDCSSSSSADLPLFDVCSSTCSRGASLQLNPSTRSTRRVITSRSRTVAFSRASFCVRCHASSALSSRCSFVRSTADASYLKEKRTTT
eukprot:scaffold4879_cov354-Prasinococcus_capsulatus_cf.AAC.9